MAAWDPQLKFYVAMMALGVVLMVVAALGEFVFGWWNDAGLWIGGAGLVLTLLFGTFAASKFQVRELGGAIRGVTEGVGRVEASTQRIEGITQRIETNTERIEANTQRIETNTERIEANTQRIEGNTHEAVQLLREIRDRLPAPGR